jgi:hypothetical protein
MLAGNQLRIKVIAAFFMVLGGTCNATSHGSECTSHQRTIDEKAATAPALAGSRDIPSARLIAAASLWHSCCFTWRGTVFGSD